MDSIRSSRNEDPTHNLYGGEPYKYSRNVLKRVLRNITALTAAVGTVAAFGIARLSAEAPSYDQCADASELTAASGTTAENIARLAGTAINGFNLEESRAATADSHRAQYGRPIRPGDSVTPILCFDTDAQLEAYKFGHTPATLPALATTTAINSNESDLHTANNLGYDSVQTQVDAHALRGWRAAGSEFPIYSE